MENEASSGTIPPGAEALVELHGEREAVERRLVLAQQRRQFGTDADDVVQAGHDEREALLELDRVLTRIRAAEYRRQPGARRW